MFGTIESEGLFPRKEWSDVLTIINGKDYRKIEVETGGYPVYGSGGYMARASEFLCPANTVIVGRKGTINNPLLIKEEFWNVDTAFGLVAGPEINPVYLYWFCLQFDFTTLNKATTLPSTTKSDLLKLKMNIPPIEAQNEFVKFAEQSDKSKFFHGEFSFDELQYVPNNLHKGDTKELADVVINYGNVCNMNIIERSWGYAN
jgi:restriction endonuclease S subunit